MSILVSFLFLLLPLASDVLGQTRDQAEQLTIIESPSFGKRSQVKTRFGFLLDQFDRLCGIDSKRTASIADMLVFSHQKLKEAGLEETLLQTSNTLHRTTSKIESLTGGKTKCTEIFAAYLMLRRAGHEPNEASEAIVALKSLRSPR